MTGKSVYNFCILFEECAKICSEPKKIYNWLIGSVLGYVNERKKQITDLHLKPQELAKLIDYVEGGKLSNLAAKDALAFMLDEGKSVDVVIKEKGLVQVSDKYQLNSFIDKVIKENKKSVNDFLSGKENAAMFLVGQTMKLSKGKANPKLVKEMIVKRLKAST